MKKFEREYKACKELIKAEKDYYKNHKTVKLEWEAYDRLLIARKEVSYINLPELVCKMFEKN
jgi:hypothetical protein